MNVVVVIACALLSGAGLYFSVGLGDIWILAWLAPIPVLWLAFRQDGGWKAFLAAFAAGLIGGCNLLPAYLGTLPPVALATGIVIPALTFALSVLGAQFVARRVAPVSGAIVFATLWTAFDYLLSFGPNGAALSPAYSQVGMPFLIQFASIFGMWAVTFLIGFFAASSAMFAATREKQFAVLALAILVINAGYGSWRISRAPKSDIVHVGLAADDDLANKVFKDNESDALAVVKAYGDAARELSLKGSNLIVLPERVAMLRPAWRGAAMAELETAAHIGHATIIIGFDDRGAERHNAALVFFPSGAPPQSYFKRHLIPGLESVFVPGRSGFMLSDHTGVAVCKDMDFPADLRAEAIVQPDLFAIPAWDFVKDEWWHARLAIMRGVENGFAMARASRNGLLTVTDAYGRVLGKKQSGEGGMVTLQGDLPRGPGTTLYARVGDSLAWICCALSFLLLVVASFARKPS